MKNILSLFAMICAFGFVLCTELIAEDFEYPDEADFSNLSWTEAFAALHEKMSTEYAFSEWKGIDWPGLKAKYEDTIAQAQNDNQASAYKESLREYVLSIPDGHVAIYGVDYSTSMEADISGSYGITLAWVESEKVVVSYVDPDSAAAQAGIEPGAEILSWNGEDILDRLKQTDPGSFASNGIATDVQRTLRRCQRLGRDAIGTNATISYRNPSDTNENNDIEEISLSAFDDQQALLNKSSFIAPLDFTIPTIEQEIVSGKYGYLRLKAILDVEAILSGETDPHLLFGNVYDKFEEILTSFQQSNVNGLIVDLRGNAGGSDELASKLSGFFYQEKIFYERQSYFNAVTNLFELHTIVDYSDDIVDALYIEPQSLYFDKPVIAIVDPGTISSGEGLAMGIQKAQNGYVVGFYGTNGSFGMTGGEITMPEGIEVHYPYGRSLDEEGVIQLDSQNGIGGIIPDFVVPATVENAIRIGKGEDVLLEFAEKKLDDLSRNSNILLFMSAILRSANSPDKTRH